MKKAALAALCLIAAFPAHAAQAKRMRLAMGTLLQVQAEATERQIAEQAVEAAFTEVDRLNRALSNYDAQSEISRLNRAGHLSPASPDLIDFLQRCRQASERTRGAFDATVEPLSRLWKLRERRIERLPSESEIAEALAKVDYRRVTISSSGVRFELAGMGVDTGGIGKGYALDRALEKMKQFGIDAATLNFGGEILYWSRAPRPRSVEVRDPRSPDRVWGRAKGTSARWAFSTSANYERFVEVASSTVKLGHLLDPRTGRPADNSIRSVTAVSAGATDADALSKTPYVLGLEEAQRWADSLPDAGILILYESSGKLKSFESEFWREHLTKG